MGVELNGVDVFFCISVLLGSAAPFVLLVNTFNDVFQWFATVHLFLLFCFTTGLCVYLRIRQSDKYLRAVLLHNVVDFVSALYLLSILILNHLMLCDLDACRWGMARRTAIKLTADGVGSMLYFACNILYLYRRTSRELQANECISP
ncbi:hypothetical protein AAVH_41152 [Aphelenchoides avenae]|nr:hypothetical protein AAVH_41152 [Aphelenchus avenae]